MFNGANLDQTINYWNQNGLPATTGGNENDINNNNLKVIVSNIILQLGVPVNIKGYYYLREAIIYKVNHHDVEIPVTKILYPYIAKMFDTSSDRVERAIRHAIEVAWSKEHSFDQDTFYHPAMCSKLRPTNSVFIAAIADRLTLLYN